MILYDILGAGHKDWKIEEIIRTFPKGSALGAFDNEFGPMLPKWQKIAESRKFPVIRPHLWWSNGHKIVSLRDCREWAKPYQRLAERFQDTLTIYLSHSCEHNSRDRKEVMDRMEILQEVAPLCQHVNCVWQGIKIAGLNEKHGFDVRGYDLVSTDGIDITDLDAEAWIDRHVAAKIIGLWTKRFNLREQYKPDSGPKLPAPKDRFAVPSVKLCQSIIRLGSPKGSQDNTLGGKPIKAPDIYKTHSEDFPRMSANQSDDPRENRPVLIIKDRATHVDVLDIKGDRLGRLISGGTFGTNQHRYYAGTTGGIGLYGYEMGEKAKRKTGSEFVYFKVGKSLYGPLNPAFRYGVERKA
jgi:hypothetical protein